MDIQQLTQHLYDKLIQDGYAYLLLKDVIQKQNTIEIIYEPLKNTPAGTQYSCTSIKDDMVKGLTQNTNDHIKVFIEEPAAA